MILDYKLILAYTVGIVFLFFLGRGLLIPMKIIGKLILNSILGGIALILINLIGGMFQFHIAFNVISILVVGILGVPGVVLLVILKFLLAA